MEQTPTFRCKKAFPLLDAKRGHIIKMSSQSVEELDNDDRFTGWRESFEPIGLEEELSLIKQ